MTASRPASLLLVRSLGFIATLLVSASATAGPAADLEAVANRVCACENLGCAQTAAMPALAVILQLAQADPDEAERAIAQNGRLGRCIDALTPKPINPAAVRRSEMAGRGPGEQARVLAEVACACVSRECLFTLDEWATELLARPDALEHFTALHSELMRAATCRAGSGRDAILGTMRVLTRRRPVR